MKVSDEVIVVSGSVPGPSVAIFAGVHGNETSGVFALKKLLPGLKITKGTLYVAFANPPAIEANVRMVGKNLNRCFYEGNKGSEYEDIRARELMSVLDKCEALLDIHMFYDDNGKPFVICEDNALQIAQTFDVDIISTNWTVAEPGATDGYMYQKGKVGICIECGPISKAVEYTDFAVDTIYRFLAYYGMISGYTVPAVQQKKVIQADRSVHKTSDDFLLQPGFENFQELNKGQLLAVDDTKEFTANAGEYIIFPHYNARVGEEAYIIGVNPPR